MYMQETANVHLKAFHMDLDRLRDEKKLGFLLSRVSVCVYEQLYAHDEIDVQTWITDGRGLSFNRCFRILRGETVVAEAFTVWALMDLDGKKLVRCEQFDYPFTGEDPLEIELPLRFRVPAVSEMETVGTRRIVYSDLDYNGHMNNTHYPDMLCDFTENILTKRVTGMTLSFLHEGAYGHTLKVLRREGEEGRTFFRTLDESGETCLEAVLTFEPIAKED
jgi:acyl-CoA thioesterase FadM